MPILFGIALVSLLGYLAGIFSGSNGWMWLVVGAIAGAFFMRRAGR